MIQILTFSGLCSQLVVSISRIISKEVRFLARFAYLFLLNSKIINLRIHPANIQLFVAHTSVESCFLFYCILFGAVVSSET